MSKTKTKQPSTGASIIAAILPVCTSCNNTMRIEVVSPALHEMNMDHVSYRCDKCGTEDFRAIRR